MLLESHEVRGENTRSDYFRVLQFRGSRIPCSFCAFKLQLPNGINIAVFLLFLFSDVVNSSWNIVKCGMLLSNAFIREAFISSGLSTAPSYRLSII